MILAALEGRDDAAQFVFIDAARFLLSLERGDVPCGDNQPALGGRALGNLDPSPINQLGLADVLAAAQGGKFLADRQPGVALQFAARDTGFQEQGLEAEEVSIVLVAHEQPAATVPQDKGLRHAFDGVPQPGLCGLCAGLRQALFGDIQRHADDPGETALRALAKTLAARVDPDGTAARQARHPKRNVEPAIDRRGRKRFTQPVAMAFRDPLEDLLTVDNPASPAEQGGGDLGHVDPVFGQIPFPDPATRRLDGQSEPLLAI